MILDRICQVYHLTKDTDNADKESFTADAGLAQVAINIQPGAAEDTILSDGTFSQAWIGFTTESGIRSGDKITVSGFSQNITRDFVIKGIEDWNMLDLPHYELTLTEFLENEYI